MASGYGHRPKSLYPPGDGTLPEELALAGPAGWMTFTTAADYAQQLINIGQYHEQWADRILGYAVFTLGHNPPWGTYDIGEQGNSNDVLGLLAAYYEQTGPVTPELPTGGTVETQIFDKDGTERDAAWLKANYGTVIAPAQVASGKKFVLAKVKVTEGPATLIVRVNDAAGAPLSQHAVALDWPEAPTDLTTPKAAVFKTISSRAPMCSGPTAAASPATAWGPAAISTTSTRVVHTRSGCCTISTRAMPSTRSACWPAPSIAVLWT